MAVEAAQMLAAMEHAGMRMTRPRQTIVEQVAAWASDGADFTADALWHAALALEPHVSRATAFRTVDVLADLGFLDRVSFADGSEHYHVVEPGTHHHHLTCERCHRVVAINLCVAPDQLAHVARATGFALSAHRVELFGRCPACQRAPA
jgi:Fur family ferric uptake transcriptional regulator